MAAAWLSALLVVGALVVVAPHPVSATVMSSGTGTWCDAAKKLRYDYTNVGVYSWIEPGDSNWVPAIDEVTTQQDPLGFTMTYFGQPYSTMMASDNGIMTLDPAGLSTTGYQGQQMPNAGAPNTVVAGLWYDWDPSDGGALVSGVTGAAGNRVYTFAWEGLEKSPEAPPTGSFAFSYPGHQFEIQLHEAGSVVEVHVQNSNGNVGTAWGGLGRILGIESAYDGSFGWQGGIYRDFGSTTLSNYGVRFTPIFDAAPVAADDSYSVAAGTPLTVAGGTQPGAQIGIPFYISSDGVLANDKDELPCAQKTAVLVTDVPAGKGTLTLGTDGGFTYDPGTFCGGSTTFTYKVDDPMGAYQVSPGTAFQSGTATVTLTVDACGAPGNQSPTAACAATTVAPYVTGFPVTFSDTGSADSDGTVVQWDWNFPGGSPSTSSVQSPAITFTTPGTYTPTLRVRDNGGAWSTAVDCPAVTIEDGSGCPFLHANFMFTTGAIEAGEPVSFSDLSTDGGGATIQKWAWDFGDGQTSTTQSLSHTFLAAGDYKVRLGVFDSVSCASFLDQTVVVGQPGSANPPPAPEGGSTPGNSPPTVDAGEDQAVPDGSHVKLSASASGSTSALQYMWRQVSGPTVAMTRTDTSEPEFTAPAAANPLQPVVLVFAAKVSDGTMDSLEDTVQVSVVTKNQHPPQAVAGKDVTVTKGNRVSVDASASSDADGDALTFAWTQTGGLPLPGLPANGAKLSLDIPADTPSSFVDLQVTATDGYYRSVDTVRIWLQGAPPPPTSFKAIPQPDGSVLFAANGAADEYVWDFGDMDTKTTASPTVTHKYTAAGTYTVELRLGRDADPVSQDVTPTVPVSSSIGQQAQPASGMPLWAMLLGTGIGAVLVAGLFVWAFRHRQGK